jgi:hypothetical protein
MSLRSGSQVSIQLVAGFDYEDSKKKLENCDSKTADGRKKIIK